MKRDLVIFLVMSFLDDPKIVRMLNHHDREELLETIDDHIKKAVRVRKIVKGMGPPPDAPNVVSIRRRRVHRV